MNDSIRQLLSLQERDLHLDRLQQDLAAIPGKIASLKAQIQAAKTALEEAKKDLTQFQLAKKEREVDLETKETAIRKHSTDLNAVKTNEAYRALLGEIDKAKGEKSQLEDQILQLLEQIDQATRDWKAKEAQHKSLESSLQAEIAQWEAKAGALKQGLSDKQAERLQAASAMPAKLLEPYERLRKNKRGVAVAPIRGEQCSGCHMRVSQNLINEVRRGQQLMTCESCSRIVYLEDAPQPAVEPAAGQSS